MAIIVCSLSLAPTLARMHRPSRAISLLDPGTQFPAFDHLHHEHSLKLEVFDVEQELDEDQPSPGPAHVKSILDFVSDWDREAPLLVHCYAGISRSTATAFIAACLHNPDVPEITIARALREASPMASPNRRFVALADAALNRDGRMIGAMSDIGRGGGWTGYESEPFTLQSRFT